MEGEQHDESRTTEPAATMPAATIAPDERVDPQPDARRSGLLAAFLVGVLLLLAGCVALMLAAADRAPG